MRRYLDTFFNRIPKVPLCFLGVGFYRAWTETVYANGGLRFPAQETASFGAYNACTIVILIVVALLARRIAPLCAKRGVFLLTGACLVCSAAMNFLSVVHPDWGPVLGWPAVLLGSLGISLIICLWSEFFGCVNPYRVGLYYSGSIILGVLILWLFKGLAFWWLFAGACLVPILSLMCLVKSYAMLPDSELPHASWGNFLVPWKPIMVVALYSFAYGMRGEIFTDVLGIHSAFGVICAALFVFVGLGAFADRFEFSFIWKCALGLMIASLVPFGLLAPAGDGISDFCALASYTLCLILIMVILSNLSYRYGVCALWVFSIERAVRLIAVFAGIAVSSFSVQQNIPGVVMPIVVLACIVVATAFVFSEKQLSSSWGAILRVTPDMADDQSDQHRLATKCHELGKQCALSSREEEILLLLAQRKKTSTIEQELYISKSTVKTHIRHIYDKAGVHSRKELLMLLGIATT